MYKTMTTKKKHLLFVKEGHKNIVCKVEASNSAFFVMYRGKEQLGLRGKTSSGQMVLLDLLQLYASKSK